MLHLLRSLRSPLVAVSALSLPDYRSPVFCAPKQPVLRRPAQQGQPPLDLANVAPVLRRPAQAVQLSWDLGDFPRVSKTFTDREQAYSELGVNQRVKSHVARVYKTRPEVSLLQCKLHGCGPPCNWRCALVFVRGGAWELRHPSESHPSAQHNQECTATLGQIGFDKLEHRQALCNILATRAVPLTPMAALRAFHLDEGLHPAGEDIDIPLKSVQSLKKVETLEVSKTRLDLGDLSVATANHHRMPSQQQQHKGFFCVRELRRNATGKAEVTLVATTRALLDRWQESDCCCIDGGRKFNVMGYPIHIIGVVNPSASIGICAIGITSSVVKEHVKKMLAGFATQVERMTLVPARKAFGMSDAETAYRDTFKEVLGCKNLMCWYHVTEAFRLWFRQHTKLAGPDKTTLWKNIVKPDLDMLHFSIRENEFLAKVELVKIRWANLGVAHATQWRDRNGNVHNSNTYLAYWVGHAPEFHFGHGRVLPTTNNCTECSVRITRRDAGSVPNSMRQFVNFTLEEVEHISKTTFKAGLQRTIDKAVWKRASEFKQILNTSKVATIDSGCVKYYVCKERAETDDVCNRESVTKAEALHAVRTWKALEEGRHKDLSHEVVCGLTKYRLFFHTRQLGTECTCRAFPVTRKCFHTLALDLKAGRIQIPSDMDFTPLTNHLVPKKNQSSDRYTFQEEEAQPVDLQNLMASLLRAKQQVSVATRKRLSSKAPDPSWNLQFSGLDQPLPPAVSSSSSASSAKKRPAAAMSTSQIDPSSCAPSVSKKSAAVARSVPSKSTPAACNGSSEGGAHFIKISITTPQTQDMPSEIEVRPGVTVATIVKQIAEILETNTTDIKVSDRKARVPGPAKGISMGAPWFEDDPRQIFEDHDLLVLPSVRGG